MACNSSPGRYFHCLAWLNSGNKWSGHSVLLCSSLSGDYFAWLWIVSSTDITLKNSLRTERQGDVTKHHELWWRIPETGTLLMHWAKLKEKEAGLASAPILGPGASKQDTLPKLQSQGRTLTPQPQQVSLQTATPALTFLSLDFRF